MKKINKSKTHRHSAGFGKRIEYWIVGLMLKDGLDVYLSLVDDHAVDAIVKKKNGSIAEIQIKARSKDVVVKDAALFAAIVHRPTGHDYWYVFYSERLDKIWLLSAKEFVKESYANKTGKNIGKRAIWFNGYKNGQEYPKEKFDKYLIKNFERLNK